MTSCVKAHVGFLTKTKTRFLISPLRQAKMRTMLVGRCQRQRSGLGDRRCHHRQAVVRRDSLQFRCVEVLGDLAELMVLFLTCSAEAEAAADSRTAPPADAGPDQKGAFPVRAAPPPPSDGADGPPNSAAHARANRNANACSAVELSSAIAEPSAAPAATSLPASAVPIPSRAATSVTVTSIPASAVAFSSVAAASIPVSSYVASPVASSSRAAAAQRMCALHQSPATHKFSFAKVP